MKVLVIPDVHLKPWMFRRAAELMKAGVADKTVCLMDIADDWNQELNIDLYIQTYDAAIQFATDFPDTIWCYGNHDVCYIWNKRESGYSTFAAGTVCRKVRELEDAIPAGSIAFLHRIDKCLFSHGGLCELFALRYAMAEHEDVDALIRKINGLGTEEMWQNLSPIWYRPQYDHGRMYGEDKGIFQVVGHTPVQMLHRAGNVISCDVFSTASDGSPVGTQAYPVINTETGVVMGVK